MTMVMQGADRKIPILQEPSAGWQPFCRQEKVRAVRWFVRHSRRSQPARGKAATETKSGTSIIKLHTHFNRLDLSFWVRFAFWGLAPARTPGRRARGVCLFHTSLRLRRRSGVFVLPCKLSANRRCRAAIWIATRKRSGSCQTAAGPKAFRPQPCLSVFPLLLWPDWRVRRLRPPEPYFPGHKAHRR